jgi:hypothetical protein
LILRQSPKEGFVLGSSIVNDISYIDGWDHLACILLNVVFDDLTATSLIKTNFERGRFFYGKKNMAKNDRFDFNVPTSRGHAFNSPRAMVDLDILIIDILDVLECCISDLFGIGALYSGQKHDRRSKRRQRRHYDQAFIRLIDRLDESQPA